MSKRDRYVPEDFVTALRKGVKGFKKLSRVHQARMAYYIWHEGTWQRRHKLLDDQMSISYKELEADFGRGKFKLINDELRIFKQTPNWSKTKSFTRGYQLTAAVQEVKSRYLKPRDRAVTRLLATNGQNLRSLPQSIVSKDTDGITAKAWNTAKPLNKIPVDVAKLRELHAHLSRRMTGDTKDLFANAEQDEIRYLTEKIGQILRLANTDIAGKGYVMHRYVEASTGRLYAKGVSLQTVPRIIKKAALHDLFEYDFENCHYAIFSQMAARYGHESEAINNYLQHKRAVREGLAGRLGLTIDQVKMCLLAIMYGARTNTWHENAIPREIGRQKAESLYKDPVFSAIADDIKQGRAIILKEWPRRRTTILNDMGKRVKIKEKPEVVLAHLIQGVEAKALRRAIELYPDHILLLMHDGFVTSDRVDARLIEREVLKATGYRLSLAGGVITLPADLEFTKM